MLEISILINKQINQMTNKIMSFNEEIVNSGLSDNINIQNAFAELTNNNHHSLENSLYWINKYLKDCKDDKIIKIKKLLEFSQANIDEAFTILDNIVSEEIVKSGLSDNINIQNAFAELTNNNHSLENSLYWINQYLKDCKDDKIIKIKKLLEFSQANIDEAFVILDNIVSM
jgi:uncharacterized protein (DUF2344 family)